MELACVVPAGVGKDLEVRVVTLAGNGTAQVSAAFGDAFSYGAPNVTGLSATTDETSGGGTVVVYGSNFGASGSVVMIGV